MSNDFIEELPPASFWEELSSRCKQLKIILARISKELENAPAKTVYSSISNKSAQFYEKKGKDKAKKGAYIPISNQAEIKSIITAEYNRKLKKAIESEVCALEHLLKKQNKVEQAYKNMAKGKKPAITPVTLGEQQYSEKWLAVNYKKKQFDENYPEYYTSNGLRVRSKSEIIIATVLDKLNIPYRYEYPVKLSRFTVHPDFYCLNVRTRKEYVWEHFGMMDDSEYSSRAVAKMQEYAKNGYAPGKNMIATFEVASFPINARYVEKIAKEYLA